MFLLTEGTEGRSLACVCADRLQHSHMTPIMNYMYLYLLRLSLQRDGIDCLPPQHAAPSRMATDELSRVTVKYKPRDLGFGSVFFQWLTSASFTRIRSTH